MAYQTYTTEALVVGGEARLTADRSVALFTREAGFVRARAAGVRRERSKLRYGLQDFSLARVSLVRGKQGWRVTGAERVSNLYFQTDERDARGALLRVLKLVRRLVRGEETHTALYDTLADGLVVIVVCRKKEIARAERILTLRILHALGYVALNNAYERALAAPSLRAALSCAAGSQSEEQAIRMAIDEALAVSHL